MAAPTVDLTELALITERHGWQRALHDVLRARSPVAYRYAADGQTATWRLLLDIPHPAEVLFVHPGVSVAPFLMAREGAAVTCACGSGGARDYIGARASQEGLPGLATVDWDGRGALGVPEGAFSAVVAVGASDASPFGTRPPAPAGAVFREARRALRPGGQLFVAGRNAPLGRGRPALGLRGCTRALDGEGFRDIRGFGILPSVWEPFFIVPLEASGSADHAMRRLATGYDFSQALSRPVWAAWRRLAGPSVAAGSVLGLTRRFAGLWPAYGLLARWDGSP